MDNRSGIMLKSLLEHYRPGRENALLQFLPRGQAQLIEALPGGAPVVALPSLMVRKVLAKVHYTWLFPLFLEWEKKTYPLMFALLSKTQAAGLARLLNVPLQIGVVSRAVKQLLNRYLAEKLGAGTLLPIEYLPLSPLNGLLTLTKPQLLQTIHLLGIFDLALEMKRVVDKELLDRVYQSLSPLESAYLKLCLRRSQPVHSQSKADLLSCIDDKKVFTSRLHKLGLSRFAMGLATENENLRWYLLHRLDRGRGQEIANRIDQAKEVVSLKEYKVQLIDAMTAVMEQS